LAGDLEAATDGIATALASSIDYGHFDIARMLVNTVIDKECMTDYLIVEATPKVRSGSSTRSASPHRKLAHSFFITPILV
jgi:hypothetical protein